MRAISLTWLGQAGFLIDGDVRILIDPFLSDHESRLYPAPKVNAFAEGIDWLLATHEHLDHLDTGFLPELIERSPDVQIVLPAPIAPQIDGLVRSEQVKPVQPDDKLALAVEVSLDVVPAHHGVGIENGYSDGSGIDGRVRFVGYVIHAPGVSIYHSGDTVVAGPVLAALEGKRIDVALLPVNGRDYFREQAGLVGNMNSREAIHFAQQIQAPTMVPMHWDMIAGNTERPGSVVEAALEIGSNVHVLTLARFQPYELVPRG